MRTITKLIKWGIVGLLCVAAGIGALQWLASERVEVVELIAMNSEGELQSTRLWVADDEGMAYLRVGADGSGWYDRIRANESVTVIRGAKAGSYSVVPRPEKSDRINELMRKKYTWGDVVIETVVGGREGSIPLELIRL